MGSRMIKQMIKQIVGEVGRQKIGRTENQRRKTNNSGDHQSERTNQRGRLRAKQNVTAGLKEITLGLVIALATIAALTYMKREIKVGERQANHDQPVTLTGQAEDPNLALRWGMRRINAPIVHAQERGKRDVVVAVIDTGCDIAHPALTESIWRNPGESGLDENGSNKASNGVDDDGNGYADDIHGWNFAESSPVVTDDHGHGTHIAGIIGAKEGVAPGVSLMILKYFDSQRAGVDNLRFTIEAIRYAVRNGADIINYSGGGIMRSQAEEEALRWAAAKGVLVVAAAGNDATNTDFFHFYPANYELPNIISVAATDRGDRLLAMSNFGMETVDLAAPGRNIFSTLPGGTYGYMSGTSQATAFVSGTAALMLSHGAKHEPVELIGQLLASGRPLPSLDMKTRSGKLLDANNAIITAAPEVAMLPNGGRKPAQKTN